MNGLAINTTSIFFQGIIPESWDLMYWLLDFESSPYQISKSQISDWDEWEKFLDEAHENVVGMSSQFLVVKPGYFSKLAPYLELDEWSYFTGVHSISNENLMKIIADFSEIQNRTSEEYFRFIEKYGALFMLYSGSWWEIYDPSNNLSIGENELSDVVEVKSQRWIDWKKSDFSFNPDPFRPCSS